MAVTRQHVIRILFILYYRRISGAIDMEKNMTNKKRQEIIDYLEKGDKFSDILIRELDNSNLTCYEKRTYSSLLDAMNGATELYCAMTEWPDNINFISRQESSPTEKFNGPYSSEYLQGFMDCMKAVKEGGFKGMEDRIGINIKGVKEGVCSE